MSVFEEAVVQRTQDHGLNSLIGTSSNMRLYPTVLPQNPTYPCVTFRVLSHNPEEVFGGASSFRRRRVEFQAHSNAAAAYNAVSAIAEQIRNCWERFPEQQGASSSITVSGGTTVVIKSVFLLGEMDLYDPDLRLYSRVIDFEFVSET